MDQPETTIPWKVSPLNSTKYPDTVYRVTGPRLADPASRDEGILLANKDHAYAISMSRELLHELANLIDFYEYTDALSPEVIEQAQAVVERANGIPRRKCGVPGCPNGAMKETVQIGPGTNIEVCPSHFEEM